MPEKIVCHKCRLPHYNISVKTDFDTDGLLTNTHFHGTFCNVNLIETKCKQT